MNLLPVTGNTCAVEASTALLPLYRCGGNDVILIDTGLAIKDREALTKLLADNRFNLRGIICTHAHLDHTGNARYLQSRYNCPVAMPLIEAGIAASPDAFRANYAYLTFAESRRFLREVCVTSDVIIPPDVPVFSFCGIPFAIVPLPGHTAGQIGVATPDGVLYLADCLLGRNMMEHAKLPTVMNIAEHMNTISTLQSLPYHHFIVAHKDIVADIRPLATYNLEQIRLRINQLLSCLQSGMDFSEWMWTFCEEAFIHTRKDLKLSVLERNFSYFLAYLEDTGLVEVQREHGAKHYTRSGTLPPLT